MALPTLTPVPAGLASPTAAVWAGFDRPSAPLTSPPYRRFPTPRHRISDVRGAADTAGRTRRRVGHTRSEVHPCPYPTCLRAFVPA